jgi:hypothetical protein
LAQFVDAWNRRDVSNLAGVLAPNAELDMSTRFQRALPPTIAGGFVAIQGIGEVERFAEQQWALGEHLSYRRASVAPGGVFALGLTATFANGAKQIMSEGKFVNRCSQSGFVHVVIVAKDRAA